MRFSFLFVLLCILFSGSYVLGDAFLVDPIVEHASPGNRVNVGHIQAGNTLEAVFSNDSGYGRDITWKRMSTGSTDAGELIQTQVESLNAKSFRIRIQTSMLLPVGNYAIPITFEGEESQLRPENYFLEFSIEKNLVKGNLQLTQVSGNVNQPTAFRILLVNDSSAKISVQVEPSLPITWSQPKTAELKPLSFEEINIDVTPRFAGPKTITFIIRNTQSGEVLETLEGTLIANPELKDRYSASLFGFPFFTISLVANYLVNAFFSLLL